MPKRLSLYKIILPFLFLALFLYILNAEYMSVYFEQNGIKNDKIKLIWEYADNALRQFLNQEDNSQQLAAEIYLSEEIEDRIFPANLGDMRLNKTVKGSEALKDIYDLHGTDVDIYRAFIPYYQGANRQAVVWIAESDEEGAAVLLMSTDEKILGNELFNNYASWIKDEVKIYKAERDGWSNYYYQKENMVYWVSIRSDEPTETFSLIFEAL